MASSNKTPHYGLSQFAPTDKPAWQGDYNADMKKIDNGIYAAQNKADSLDASVSEAENKATQALEKAEAAEDAAENAAALAQEAKTTADNISGDLSGKVNKAGDTMTGPLVLPGDPTEDNQAATKKYVDEHGGGAAGDYLPLSGGTMTGTIRSDATTPLQTSDLGSGITKNPIMPAVVKMTSRGSSSTAMAVTVMDGDINPLANEVTIYKANGSDPKVNVGGMPIENVGTPTADTDAATKAYVDAAGGTSGNAGSSTPEKSVTINPNLFLKFGNMVFLNTTVTIPQTSDAFNLFSIPYPNLTGKRLTTSLIAVPPTSRGTDSATLTAKISGNNIVISTVNSLGAGTYALSGWILIREV